MRAIFFWLLCLVGAAYAGTNSLTSVSGGKVLTSHINQYYTALNQDLLPRNSTGTVTAVGGNLGTSSYPWLGLYFGAAVDGMSIVDTAGAMNFKNTNNTFQFGASGPVITNVSGNARWSGTVQIGGSTGPIITNNAGTAQFNGSIQLGGASGPVVTNGTDNSVTVLKTGFPIHINSVGSGTVIEDFSANTLQICNPSNSSCRPAAVSASPSTNGLMIVRGRVSETAGGCTVSGGEGWGTVSRSATGTCTMNFGTSFQDTPVCSATIDSGYLGPEIEVNPSTSSVIVDYLTASFGTTSVCTYNSGTCGAAVSAFTSLTWVTTDSFQADIICIGQRNSSN